MSLPDNAEIRTLFGTLMRPPSTRRPQLQGDEDVVQKSNKSLVIRNVQLKNELGRCRKEIEGLRNENQALREQLHKFETVEHSEQINLIVEQRFEKKLQQFLFIVDRTRRHLEKTSEDLRSTISDQLPTSEIMRMDELSSIRRVSKKQFKNTLSRVDESPRKRGRRSGMVHDIDEEGITREQRYAPHSPLRECQISLESAPTASPIPPRHGLTDSIRRKRFATLKIKSLREPSLNNKIRRPAAFNAATDSLLSISGPEA